MLREFREFITRGSLVELAVAFIMGVAFSSVVSAFSDVILGAVAYAFGGDVSFDRFGVERDGELVIPYGAFLTALLDFAIVAFALFLVVKAYNRLRRSREETPTTRPCPYCRLDIDRDASRCPHCTSQLEARPV
ncbi:MAG: large conductance mechanosensitive channel protein MscL [Actinomycetota bacterium]